MISRLRSWWRLRSRTRKRSVVGSKRELVNEILTIQIISAAVIGALAIASLYWGGQWILKDNYSRWALQWTDELNELGAPLYLDDDGEALLRLESFVERYPEIARVAYFDKTGQALYSVDNQGAPGEPSRLQDERLAEVEALVGTDQAYILNGGILDPRKFEILAPVWTESLSSDGLFTFDVEKLNADVSTELVGFVAIHLDFLRFHNRLLSNIKVAIVILLAVLIAFAWFGQRALRNALESFSQLEKPIRELAKGNLGVKFAPAEHREISDIVEALETTATALSARDEELLKLANHDALTGLYNRRRFLEELKTALGDIMRTGKTGALFFIDLDQFKYVNDACGHPAGDRLIRKVADELNRCIDANAVVARFGGDEFSILLPTADEEAARSNAELILAAMRRMAHVEDDRIFHIHCSIGITMIVGNNLHPDELIGQADFACREAKLAGRNRYFIFDKADILPNTVSADVGWMNRLRRSIDEDLFELLYQPINCVETGETTHHEVLIRARADDGKLVSPDAFLPTAVRFGLMSEIDNWVVRNAAKAYARFVRENPRLKFSINLSANAFENEDLHIIVREAFAENNVPPQNVILEITESLAIRRPAHVEHQIAALRELGCEVALDDFGTGYSSFSYLQKLHFDYIKIDGAFVEDILNNPIDQKMIRLIAEVGHDVGMKIIAEYVQSAEALELLGELGVDLVQGFFVGKPVAVPQLAPTPISLNSRRKRHSSKSN